MSTEPLQVWYKAGNAGAGCWVADSDPGNNCLTYTSGHPSGTVFNLSQGVTFGFGTLATGPTPGQPTPTQAAACLDNSNSSLVSTTPFIVFNSPGIPTVNINSPISTGPFYPP